MFATLVSAASATAQPRDDLFESARDESKHMANTKHHVTNITIGLHLPAGPLGLCRPGLESRRTGTRRTSPARTGTYNPQTGWHSIAGETTVANRLVDGQADVRVVHVGVVDWSRTSGLHGGYYYMG